MNAAEIFKKLVDDGTYKHGSYMCHALSCILVRRVYDATGRYIVGYDKTPHPWLTPEYCDIGKRAIIDFMLSISKPSRVFSDAEDPDNVWAEGKWLGVPQDTPPLVNLMSEELEDQLKPGDLDTLECDEWIDDAYEAAWGFTYRMFNDWDNRFELLKEYYETHKWNS